MLYLILALSLSGNGVIFDLSLCVHLYSQGIGGLLLPSHLQRKLGNVDLRESSPISEILHKQNIYSRTSTDCGLSSEGVGLPRTPPSTTTEQTNNRNFSMGKY